MRLILPTASLETTYRDFVADFEQQQEPLIPWVLSLTASSFDELIEQFKGFSRGIGLKEGFVPHSTYWLIDEKQNLVGVSNLRHELTPSLEKEGGHIGYGVRPAVRRKGHATELLRLTLLEARKLGLERVLLTYNRNNLGSARVIEKNGGLLESEVTSASGEIINRYWITLG